MSETMADCIADTSAIIGLSRHDPTAIAVIGQSNFAITYVTVAELALGIRKARKANAALRQIDRVLQGRQVFYPSELTPLIYAEVCHELEKEGIRIPSNDMWIAAVALENNLPLVARDEHFTRVKGLRFRVVLTCCG